MDLAGIKCTACKGEPSLKDEETARYLREVSNWILEKSPDKITKDFEFKNFREATGFINSVADIAESEGHHPNIYLHDYKKVRIELWTHKIGGLHRNDFIMAAKIDSLKT